MWIPKASKALENIKLEAKMGRDIGATEKTTNPAARRMYDIQHRM